MLAVAESVVLWMDYRKILRTCPAGCAFHHRLVENMLAVVADKNLMLNRRIGHPRSAARGKAALLSLGAGRPARQRGIFHSL
ncbi:MAG: hypothetical protein ACLS8R_07780 [Anaeromassilibacillus sp.]